MAKLIHNLPIPDLDDEAFEELVEEARARIPLYAPKWTDHNLSDPGITLLELFAWLAEMQIYSLNLIPERNYRKFLRLLGEKPRPAAPARVDVTLAASESVLVPGGTQVAARESTTGEEIVFETDAALDVLPGPVKLERIVGFADFKYTDHTEANERVGVFYHALGEKARSGNILYLGFAGLDGVSGKKMTMTVYLYESDLPPRGQHGRESPQMDPPAHLVWEYRREDGWTSLGAAEQLQDDTILLTQSGRISFNMPSDIARYKLPSFLEDDYNLFWIRCRAVRAEYEIPPRIDMVRLNTISATHGITIEGPESLGQSSGLPDQAFPSQNRPIIPGTQEVTVLRTIDDEPVHEIWEVRDDLDASGPEDKHYLLRAEEGQIVFGDGVNGRIPPKGSEIMMAYRYGGGEIGNISSDVTWKPLQIEGKTINLKNERPASGGVEEESIEAAQARVRRGMKVPYRAVTAEDYESIAKSTPGLRVARAFAAPSPVENLVTVTVVPYSLEGRPDPSKEFLDAVCAHLDKHRLLTTDLRLVKPDYVQISVDAEVRIEPQSEPVSMRGRIEKALNEFLHPLRGGPGGTGWPFGRSVYQSEVYAVIEGVGGVDCVTKLSLRAAGRDYRYENGNIKIAELQLVYPGTHSIEISMAETVCKEGNIT